MKKLITFLLTFGISAAPLTSYATFSVVGVDKTTGQVGGALASCTAVLGREDASAFLYAFSPGVGVVHGQSFYFNNRKDSIRDLLSTKTPAEIIQQLIADNDSLTPNPTSLLYETNPPNSPVDAGNKMLQRRQYGIAAMNGTAAFTGQSNEAVIGTPEWRGHKRGLVRPDHPNTRNKRYAASVQGNTLTGENVLAKMSLGFSASMSKNSFAGLLKAKFGIEMSREDRNLLAKEDLAGHLFRSLMRGGDSSSGDKRCVRGDVIFYPSGGISSNQAYLRVDGADGNPVMHLRYRCANVAAGCPDALKELAKQYIECRKTNDPVKCGAPSTVALAEAPIADSANEGGLLANAREAVKILLQDFQTLLENIF